MNAGDITVRLTLDGKDMELGIKDASRHLRQLQSNLSQTAQSVNKLEAAQSSLGSRFRNLVITLGNLRFAVMDIHDVFLRLPAAIIATSGELERTQQLLVGLSDKMTDAARKAEGAMSFDYIANMAKRAPFEISALSESFVKLKSGGLDPAAGSLSTMVDTVARFGGSADSLKRANVAIQQMLGKSVISMEELRQQLGEAAPSAMKDMATGMGMTMAKLAKAVSTGTVEASDAINKMLTVMRLNNSGAANAMMNTWTGSLSRLKTEWELTAQFIANSGFGDASKAAADELRKELASPEFKRFAAELGQGMGSAVRALVDFTRSAVEMAGTIKNLAIAWGAYKVATMAINKESLDGFAKSRAAFNEEVREKIAGLNKQVASRRAAAIEDAQIESTRTAALAAENAKALRAFEASLAAREAALAAAKAREAAIMAAPVTGERAGPLSQRNKNAPTLGLSATAAAAAMASSQAGSEGLRRLRSEITSTTREVQILSTQVADHSLRQQNLARAVTESSEKMGAAHRMAGAASGSMKLMAGAATALGTAFNALGGWMTVANLAIAAGVTLLLNWESAASKAEKRARNMVMRTTNKEDVEAEGKALQEIVTKRAAAEAEVARMRARGDDRAAQGSLRRQGYDRRLAELQELQGQERGIRERFFRMQSIFEQNEASARVEQAREDDQRRLDQIAQVSQQERSLLDKRYAARIEAAKGNQKELDKIAKEQGDEVNRLSLEMSRQKAAFLRSRISSLAGNMDAESIGKLTYLRDMLKGIDSEIESAQRAVTGKNPGSEDNKREKGLTPIQRLSADLKADIEELKIQLASYKGKLGEVDRLGADADVAAAGVRKRVELGLYDSSEDKKRVRPGEKETAAAAALASEKATVQNQLELLQQIDRMKADSIQARAEVSETIADPLGISAQAKKISDVEQLFARIRKTSGNMVSLVEETEGLSLDNLEGRLKGNFSARAASELLTKLEQQNKEVNAAIVADNRQAAEASERAQLKTFDDKTKAFIERLRKNGTDSEMIARIEGALNQNIKLQSQVLAKKFETPIQKLASEWDNATKNMQEATARWANGAMDAWLNFIQTGKLEWKNFVVQVLADVLRIKAQKAITESFDLGKIGAAVGGFFGFADGGIMTSAGAVPLRKYAAGGIANSPQLAMYGEGSKPEAYVPLPDGRSIPVTMKGAGGVGNVVVNVINQTSTPVNSNQVQPRFDGKQLILDVVLSAASQPGNFRDGMRNMMGAS